MPSLAKLEKFLAAHIFPDLEHGRPQFDLPHTQNVVKHLKHILSFASGDSIDDVALIIAAYAHDWGYANLFAQKGSVDYQEVQDMKALHMVRGAEKLRKLLTNSFFSFLSLSQKERAVHLVFVHDRISALKDTDEIILMEADTLGSLDNSGINAPFDPASEKKFIAGTYRKRLPRFMHDEAKKEAERLISLRVHSAD